MNGSKKRLALILSVQKLDITVCFISSQLHQQESSDLLLKPNLKNGLKKDSSVRIGKIATIDKALVIGKLGDLEKDEIVKLDNKLVQVFGINIHL